MFIKKIGITRQAPLFTIGVIPYALFNFEPKTEDGSKICYLIIFYYLCNLGCYVHSLVCKYTKIVPKNQIGKAIFLQIFYKSLFYAILLGILLQQFFRISCPEAESCTDGT